MEYKLVRKNFGIQKTETVHTFEEDSKVKDICYVPDLGFFFIVGHALSLLNNDGEYLSPWCGNKHQPSLSNMSVPATGFSNPSSLYLSKNKLYVCELNGASIRKIDLKTFNVSSLLKGELQVNLLSKFKKAARYNGETAICIGANDAVFWSSEVINKCFYFKGAILKTIIGTGRRGFSNATQSTNSMVDRPKGLVYSSGGVYLVDSGNGCIRQISNGTKVIYGNPHKEDTLNMSKMASCKSSVYVLCNSGIIHVDLGSSHDVLVYESKKVVSMATDKDRNLYIVEET